MRFIVSLIFLLSQFALQAQANTSVTDLDEILKKTQDFYKNESSYYIETQYKLFENHKDSHPLSTYKGEMGKMKNTYYNNVLGTEMYVGNDIMIKASHDQKAIEVSNNTLNGAEAIFNISGFLKSFKDYKVVQKEEVIRCELLAPELTSLPYGKIILYINKKDYSLQRQVMYYLHSSEYKNEKGEMVVSYPKLEINFSQVKPVSLLEKEVFNKSYYIVQNKGVIQPANNFANYKVINRI